MHHHKEFFETIPIGICVVERDRQDFKILFANHAFLYLLKDRRYVTPREVVGRKLADIWPSAAIVSLVQKLKGPTPPRDFSIPIDDRDDDARRWAKITIGENNFEGQDCYALWITDISASKEAEIRLKRAVKDADALAQAKSNFLATMSHEIRTPMQTVYGFLELINEEKPPQAIHSMVDTAKKSASGLLEILDDILDFAKMDADQMELDHFEVPVRTLVRGTLEALSVKVHGKDVKIHDEIDGDVPFVIVGDPKRLRQIIMNLAGNALKFTERGHVTVHVSTKPQVLLAQKHGLILHVEIRDTGIGMSEEACFRLFKPFSQADSSTSRKYGGTGLGLSISKRLVELMGGQIGVHSVPGEGSTFWFEIPTQEVSIENSAADLPSLDGISVLSVEDHPLGAREIVKSLQSMGAAVETCPTYKEALDLVRRRPFDIGIIDQGLPDGLGLDLIRDIMDIRPDMGLIMYTVRDDIGMQHSLQSMGVAYLPKPASRIGLGTAVKDATRKMTRANPDGLIRLLIAEDNVTVREVLRRQLSNLHVEADFVSNGREAITALENGAYSILFTDLHMPDIDGYGLVRTLRQNELRQGHNGGHFPIVVLTADVQMAQRHVYLAQGFDECLLKPVSLGQLRRLLMRWSLLPDREDSIHPKSALLDSATGQVFDINLLMTQMGLDRTGAIEILGLFIEMTAPLINQIQHSHQTRNYPALSEHAHSLKGAAHSACCYKLGDLAAKLQDDSDAKKSNDAIVVQIADTFHAIETALQTLTS